MNEKLDTLKYIKTYLEIIKQKILGASHCERDEGFYDLGRLMQWISMEICDLERESKTALHGENNG